MIELVETDAALTALAPAWSALWAETPGAGPFQSPHWLLPWWRRFGTASPRIAVLRRGAGLAGILPLYVLEAEAKALPIGAGTTDYLDALGEGAGDLLAAALERLRVERVTRLDLIDVPPGSGLPDAAPQGWTATWSPATACPVLSLPGLPMMARRKLRMNRNRAGRAGGWSVEGADGDDAPGLLADLARLHQARWTAQGEAGAMADPRVLGFWDDAAPGLLASGLLRLRRLRIGGAVASVIAALLAPGRLYFYLSGFDEAHAYCSPGSLLLGAMLEEAIDEGRTEAHFLRGREAYKYAWGAVDRRNRDGRFSRAAN